MPYIADIGVIPNPEILDNLVVYHAAGFPYSDAILGGTIERLHHEPKAFPPSRKEVRMGERLLALGNQFIAESVTITPESIWSSYPKMNRFFGEMTVFTIAPPPSHPHAPLGFSIWQDTWFNKQDLRKRLYYSVRERNGEIDFDPSRPPEHWQIFRLDSRDFRKPVKFCYLKRCVSLSGWFNEIYDPVTRNIIGVFRGQTLRGAFR